jgi:hypothetical protein
MAKTGRLVGSIGMGAGGTLELGDGSSDYASMIGVQLTGTWTGTVTFQGTIKGDTWVNVLAVPSDSTTAATTATANGVYRVDATGLSGIRLNGGAGGTGTVVAYARPTLG